MEACLAVEKEVDRILSKFTGISEHATRILEESIQQITSLKAELENAPEDHILTSVQIDIIKQAVTKVKDTISRLASDHKDIHCSVSKLGKSIDRNFVGDFAATSREHAFSSPEKVHLINKVIAEHYYRHGMHDVADILCEEANVTPQHQDLEPFSQLNHILDCLRRKDLEPALAWATAHSESLRDQHSSLEFQLHRLKFIELLSHGPDLQTEAISYARTHFRRFVDKHEKDIQTLMGMLLYVPNGISASPYSNALDEDRWMEIDEVFIQDACHLLGISRNSPLATCINAGCIAVPALHNIKQVMVQRQVTGIWNGKEELPIEIDLGESNKYHSMFACPILRQQSTLNNPPMRLICGHVISKDALHKLASTSTSNKMKCPYCPVEQSAQEAKIIYF